MPTPLIQGRRVGIDRDETVLNFPLIVADSIRYGYFNRHLPVHAMMIAWMPHPMLKDPDGKPILVKRLAGESWVPLEQAVAAQVHINARKGIHHDPRFD